MKRICTTVDIEASPGDVWEILSDVEEYHKWNPFIKRIHGKLQAGEKLDVRMKIASFVFHLKPLLLNTEINKEIRWKGRFLINGLFDGEHLFRIEEMENGNVHFINCEKFTGVLVPLFMYLIKKDTENGFNAMNEQLKKKAEKKRTERVS
jgi:hypothetical protein